MGRNATVVWWCSSAPPMACGVHILDRKNCHTLIVWCKTQTMSTIIDAPQLTTVTPNTTNPPALIAVDANWFLWIPVMRHVRPFDPNAIMEIVD